MKERNFPAVPGFGYRLEAQPVEQKVYKGFLQTVRLNELLSVLLKQMDQAVPTQLVFRLDPLPQVEADVPALQQTFETMLSTILQQEPPAGRLFIHVKCENTGVRLVNAHSRKMNVRYRVDFCTNVAAGLQWMHQHEAVLQKVRQQFLHNDITFDCHPDHTNGCLFSLIIPGKQES